MAIEKHPVFKDTPSLNSKLWRFMSLAKYISLLQNKSLFLCNLEYMAKLDPFEGTYPPSKFQHRDWKTIDDVPVAKLKEVERYQPTGALEKNIGFLRYKEHVELRIRQSYANRKSYFVNCWHANEHESSAMWDIYSSKEEGLAIVTSPKSIHEALNGCSEGIFCGLVSYGDYNDKNFEISEENAFNLIMKKRESFSHEKEFRIVYWDTSVTHKKKKKIFASYGPEGRRSGTTEVTLGREIEEIEKIEPRPGHLLKCDLSKLIQTIYVSPLAEEWMFKLIKDVTKQYSVDAPVIQSDLMTAPLR
jgi:hypothetical protein